MMPGYFTPGSGFRAMGPFVAWTVHAGWLLQGAAHSQLYSPMTESLAQLLAFPTVNLMRPCMSGDVFLRVRRYTGPRLSRSTWGPGCRVSSFRLHRGGRAAGTDTSHSKWASFGAVTSMSSSSRTISSAWAGWRERVYFPPASHPCVIWPCLRPCVTCPFVVFSWIWHLSPGPSPSTNSWADEVCPSTCTL